MGVTDQLSLDASQRSLDRSLAALEESRQLRADVVSMRLLLSEMLSAVGINHRWIGSRLDLRLPDGTYAIGTDLAGAPGAAAWTMVPAIVGDGDRRVIQVVDWVGGAGAKPAIGRYIGFAGLVDDIAEATSLRGPGFRVGTGAPNSDAGIHGDSYLDIYTGRIFEKTADAWVYIATIAVGLATASLDFSTLTNSGYIAILGDL